MTVFLLDANVLIALTVADHEHHDRVGRWFSGGVRVAISPVVEGALVRFLVRLGERPSTAQELIRHVHEHPACRRWPDDVSYIDVDLEDVRGHRQVTDTYLAELAAAHSGTLATLDESLAARRPGQTMLLPR
ncbi:TA system VapC family ribonuclease toxin [uncultured Amnibacterium sp.]|uniref:TA system VapC family ribonuclease toxin n=1 Tax=uncultured Amnibacterium sp. TaxID=1631851 RepID=UPI0035CA690F